MRKIQMSFADIGGRKITIIILSFIVTGVFTGFMNSWMVGQFPSIRSEAKQKLSEVATSYPTSLFQIGKLIFKKWALNEQLKSTTSSLTFAGWAILDFFILYALIARFLFRKKMRECKFSYLLSTLFATMLILSVIFFSSVFHLSRYGGGTEQPTLWSALVVYLSLWFAWLVSLIFVILGLRTRSFD